MGINIFNEKMCLRYHSNNYNPVILVKCSNNNILMIIVFQTVVMLEEIITMRIMTNKEFVLR